MASTVLDDYDSLDIIGNGSFGIIRKVRRRSDGKVFARKELNFERMTERDRKQIVAEVNILKDLDHTHIVRYHDRHVDRDAGVLYILMEYCGGGDLSSVIKMAAKQNRPVAEDAIWHYFYQILLALNHCHNTGGHGRTSSAGSASELEGKDRRNQILHRDLKPDNVFLDENNTVKLGDFGLSKALSTASFANTYVGTPYYMSPELMQEKAYDSKSDIWSLGCLIYELCALKPPFHEAQTHNELSCLIRSGRIPPLPRGYSQQLSTVIKAMLNLNPAMRPSAAQLLLHERIEWAKKVAESEKTLNSLKTHRAALHVRERDLMTRENALNEKESHITELIQQRDAQIHSLQSQLQECQTQLHQAQVHIENQPSLSDIQVAVKQREEELRVLVLQREEEVSRSMQRREDEIMEAIRRREAEVLDAWSKREEVLREEFRAILDNELEAREKVYEERDEEMLRREAAVKEQEENLTNTKALLEEKVRNLEDKPNDVKKDRAPLDEIQNILSRAAHQETPKVVMQSRAPPKGNQLSTPLPRSAQMSAMKGVVLTTTGEALATPSPVELVAMFDLTRRFEDEVMASPKVGLNFAQVFDFENKERVDLTARLRDAHLESESDADDEETTGTPIAAQTRPPQRMSRSRTLDSEVAPPTRIRRPSIRTGRRPTLPASVSDPTGISDSESSSSQTKQHRPKPLPHPHLGSTSGSAPNVVRTASAPAASYDLADEENLPSPFLKRTERERAGAPSSASVTAGSPTPVNSGPRKTLTRRQSGVNALRVVAAANVTAVKQRGSTGGAPRSSISRAGSTG
ncbi:Protein kinase domain-containing protein [Mycena indigotica]|uniref:non-specific serine/threonine protein kinase n=1 Tax=Mycena indigotica TaxID=2126181 RepID=A0A8H6WET3_9AGAR|nr:Protein kinase domain-containing protein [Mycena indigotica]KAF7309804.1 Protein kinase domain-containing protein [Mycena indigotica]